MKTPIIMGISLALLGLAAPASRAASMPASAVADADQGRADAPGQQKRFRATRPIVSDAQTGQWRMPTDQEVVATVANLLALTNRSASVQETSLASRGVAVDLDGGFAGVMLARPNEDGSLETLCVFTFEEGAEFLGLVEVVQ